MKTILVVEDSEEIRENIGEILSLSDYNVLKAENGKEGLNLVYKHMPDLIISDIMMPVVDGFGMLHVLKNDPKTEVIPFIFLTARSERNFQREAMELGADDYITKPFNGYELLKAVDSRFKKISLLQKSGNAPNDGLNGNTNDTNSVKYTDLESLLCDREILSLTKRQSVYREGKYPHCLFYIKHGKVMTFKTHEDGKNLIVGLFKEGDFLGYLPLLEHTNYNENAEAIEDTELLSIPAKDFFDSISVNHELRTKLFKLMAENFNDMESHILGIAYNTLRKKVAEALTTIYKKYQIKDNENFCVDLSREELASLAGTATESLIRTLHDFKNEMLIEIKDGKVIIIDHKKLEHLIR